MATTIKPGIQEDGSWCVPTFKLDQLKHRVDVLNRRVRKTGGQGLTLVMQNTEIREVPVEGSVPRVESWTFVRIAGSVPCVDGWEFVARVEHHAGVGNIISRAPNREDVQLPDSLRTDAAICEHCATKRVRNDTFVLRSDGVLKRVGRNCLADFLRGCDPAEALRLWSILSSVRSLLSEAAEEGFSSGRAQRGFGTIGFLACTVSAIRHDGWTSKAAANGTDNVPTANTAAWLADKAPTQDRARERWTAMRPTEADYEEAGEVVAWAQALEEAQLNDYLSNLRVAVSLGFVERRHEGIVASGVAARRRDAEKALERLREATRQAARPPSQFVGVKEKRYPFCLTVTSAKPVAGFYGSSTLLLMEDQDGNEIKTFLRGDCSFKAGDTVHGKGTVKEHEEYKGRKQTVLIRCALAAGTPAQGLLPIPTVSTAPAEAPAFSDEEIPF